MDNTYFVKNISEYPQAIVAIGEFEPQEIKQVSYNKYKRLMRNPNFELVEDQEPVLESVDDEGESDDKKPKVKSK